MGSLTELHSGRAAKKLKTLIILQFNLINLNFKKTTIMNNLQVRANLGINENKYHIGLSLIEFVEDDVIIVYSPALDLSGYGATEDEAKKSFSEAMDAFFKYTTNKKTLDIVLKELGWSIKGSKKRPKFNPPKDSDMVFSNSLYNEIVNQKSYKVSRQEVEFSI